MPPSDHGPDGKFFIVGIGASAGGLEASTEFFNALPPDTGMAFILVQHLQPTQVSHLPEIIARATQMPVQVVQEGLPVEPNNVYVVPPNAILNIRDSVLHLSPRSESLHPHHSIDEFFFSLAADQGTCAVGLVLSGSSSDGTQGLQAIKGVGGTTFCQSEESARYGGMPHSAIASGCVDFILSPGLLAGEVSRVSRSPLILQNKDLLDEESPDEVVALSQAPEDFFKIIALLRDFTHVDFSQYKKNMIQRRVGRRMVLHNFSTLADYRAFLESHPTSLDDLYRDLLINVTQFFREPATFTSLALLEAELLPKRDPSLPFRLWSAGCASGEEPYSLAMAILEASQLAGQAASLQVFGTDISDASIERARAGIYPALIHKDVSKERLAKFFSPLDFGYRISKGIRESCIFARHDLLSDPPFSQMDLVSCRNVLIYFGPLAQQRILQALHYSLRPDGILILGAAESIASRGDLFEPLDNENKIFTKKMGVSRFTMTMSDTKSLLTYMTDKKAPESAALTPVAQVELNAARALRDLYVPPGVTVNDAMQIILFHGQTALYLEQPSGEATLNLLRVANHDLLFPLRKAIDTAAEHKRPVYEPGNRFEREGKIHEVALRVIPIYEAGARYYMILFEAMGEEASSKGDMPAMQEPEPPPFGVELTQARTQLEDTRDYLRKMIEQHEVAVEELRAAHEEVQSSNEEMQSTNEELRTAKEELQSSNEELITVNDELNSRNSELSDANNDLSNVLNAVSVPIVMVGMDSKIRRYTPAAARLLTMVPSDIGRLVTLGPHMRDVPGLEWMVAKAIQTLSTQEQRVLSRDNRWYTVQVSPYRTTDDRIDGAVITFVDTDDLARALQQAENARDFAEGIVETVQHPLLVLDQEMRIQRATSAFFREFQVSPAETQGQPIFALGNGQWNIPELRKLLSEALIRDVPFHDLPVDADFPRIGRRSMLLNARRITRRDSNDHTILLAIEDVTERKAAAEIQFRKLFEAAKDGLVVIEGDTGEVLDVNPCFLELTRFVRTENIGKPFWEIPAFRRAEPARRLVEETMAKGVTRFDSVLLQANDGRRLVVDLVANRYEVRGKTLIQVNVRDVTERRQVEEDLRRSNLDLQQFAFAASHDLQEPLRTVINQAQHLQRQYRGKMGPDADVIIDFITSGADRMRHMVLDLLSYAQTSRATMAPAPVNVEAVLATAVSNLQLAIQGVNARITWDPLPTVVMDQTQLLQLLQNLIGNALKYHGTDPPLIHLSSRKVGSEWIFSVQDNGIGIEPRFFEHVFTVFKRLHGSEYPGTGIGLATCKRIVERHGGRIWVESEPGKGSTFFFSVRVSDSDGSESAG